MPGRHQVPPGTIPVIPERVSPRNALGGDLSGLPRKIRQPAALKTGPPRSENLTLRPGTAPGAGTHRAAAAGPFFLREVPLAVAISLPPPAAERRKVGGQPEHAIQGVMARGARPDHLLVARAKRRGRRVRTRCPCFQRQPSPPPDTPRALVADRNQRRRPGFQHRHLADGPS